MLNNNDSNPKLIVKINKEWLSGQYTIPDYTWLIGLEVEKDMVLSIDFNLVEQMMSSLCSSTERIKHFRAKVHLSLQGYSQDPREAQEIPEVRSWFVELNKRYPYFPFFINNELPGIDIKIYLGMIAVEINPDSGVYRDGITGQVLCAAPYETLIALLFTISSNVAKFCVDHHIHWDKSVSSLLNQFCSQIPNDVVDDIRKRIDNYFRPDSSDTILG